MVVPAASEWEERHTQRVLEACGRCHVAPQPDALPRATWEEKIRLMASGEIPLPSGVKPLDREETALAQAYYARRAPSELPPPPSYARDETLSFKREEFSPAGELRSRKSPAVANVNFVALSSSSRLDLVVAELRSRALFLLPTWLDSPQQRQFRLFQRDLGYAAHTEFVDLNGDGRLDVLVADLGGMDPSNSPQGRALLLLQRAERGFDRHVLATNLGRVADVRAADWDADGDLDVAVCAFGWRGPGQLLLLENRTTDWREPRFQPRLLDERDGFIHVEAADLDGDGRLDLAALLSQEHEQVLVYRQDERLKFEPRVVHQAPHPAWGYSGLELVDLDQDGDLDLLVSNGDSLDDDLLKPYHGVSWLENHGQLRFTHHPIAALAGCERAVAGDLDADGDLDVVAVSFLPQLPPQRWQEHDLDSVIWIERTKQGWQPHSLEKHRCLHPTVALGDYNGDRRLDIAVGNYVWIVGEGGQPLTQAECVTLFTAD